MKISNEEISERIQRMGIECRSGVLFENCYDLAIKQLKIEDAKSKIIPLFKTIEDWFNKNNHNWAFIDIENRELSCKIIHDINDYKLISWSSPTMPLLRLK